MKKISGFALVFALAACSHGGNGGEVVEYDSITHAVAVSNRQVTQMASEVVVLEEDDDDSGSRAQSDTPKYTKYRLDNVNFKTLITPGQIDSLKFTLTQNGQIDGIVFTSESGNIPDAWTTKMARRGGNEFVSNADETLGRATVKYNSYATNSGLRYSDFGTTDFSFTDEHGTEQHVTAPFIAGYAVKNIDYNSDSLPDTPIVFTGSARGMVEYADGTEQSGYLPLSTTGATLTLDNGTEVLAANFNNWHKMTATKTDGEVTGVTFTAPDDPIDDLDPRFQMAGENPTFNPIFETGYYGDEGVPSEGNALVQYQERIDESNEAIRDNNRTVYVGFGGKAPTSSEP